jgi:TonB family protein
MALITVLFNLKVWVEINFDQLEVREVILVSPEQLFIPSNIEDFMRRLQKTGKDELGKESNKGTKLQDRAGAREDNAQVSESESSQELYSTESEKNRTSKEEGAFLSDLASIFKLGGSFKSESDLPADYVLDFSLDFGKTLKLLSEAERVSLERNIQQLKFPRSGFFNIGFSKSQTGVTNYGVGGATQEARASFRVEDYDISPWAEQVVNTILVNWIIPYPQELGVKGVVGISVVIEKNGELSSARVVNSSLVLLLDEAALKALRESAPFPALPDEFPRVSIEAYFEFHYGD